MAEEESFINLIRSHFPTAQVCGPIHILESDGTVEARLSGIHLTAAELFRNQTNKFRFRIENGNVVAQMIKTDQTKDDILLSKYLIAAWFVGFIATLIFVFINQSDYKQLLISDA